MSRSGTTVRSEAGMAAGAGAPASLNAEELGQDTDDTEIVKSESQLFLYSHLAFGCTKPNFSLGFNLLKI